MPPPLSVSAVAAPAAAQRARRKRFLFMCPYPFVPSGLLSESGEVVGTTDRRLSGSSRNFPRTVLKFLETTTQRGEESLAVTVRRSRTRRRLRGGARERIPSEQPVRNHAGQSQRGAR